MGRKTVDRRSFYSGDYVSLFFRLTTMHTCESHEGLEYCYGIVTVGYRAAYGHYQQENFGHKTRNYSGKPDNPIQRMFTHIVK
jgi:hypothetical protein